MLRKNDFKLFLGVLTWGALCALNATYAQDELVDLVVGLLNDPDKDVRAVAYEQIRSEAPGEEATKKFAALLPDLSEEVQVELLSALAARGDSAAAPAVRELHAQSKSDQVRMAVISSLGKLGGVDDLPLLIRSLSSNSKEEQDAARRSLVVMPGEEASAAIAQAMSKSPPEQSVELIKVLTTRRARNTFDEILAAAVDDDASVRAAAMESLGTFAEPKHVPGMVQGVLKAEPGRERDTAEKRIMLVCHRIEDQNKQAAPLLAAMDELSPSDQNTLLSTLGRVGGPEARKVIEGKIDDAEMHRAGLEALCNWPHGSIAFRLLELARTEDEERNRRLCLRSLIRVAPLPDDRSDQLRLDLMRTAMAMCWVDDDRLLILERLKAVRTIETLRFVLPYVDQPKFAEQACLTVVELAHHSELREENREEFHAALDHVIEVSQDATIIDRAERYKTGQTWVRPK